MKDWTESKTVIINTVLAALSLIMVLAQLVAGPEIAQLGIDPEVARWAGIVLLLANGINIWLRTQTGQPLRGTRAARRARAASTAAPTPREPESERRS